jgi:uncharacterized protein YjiK
MQYTYIALILALIAFTYEASYPVIGKSTYKKLKNVKELSGLALSEDASFLWGVGDEGDFVKISTDGDNKVTKITNFDDDTEGITINRDTGDLIVSLEPNKVGIIKKSGGFKKLQILFKIQEAAKFGNAGLEGITYYKDGYVYVGSQSGPYLWKCDLKGKCGTKQKLKNVVKELTEVAGLCYDHERDRLWIIDSNKRRLYLLSGDAKKLLTKYELGKIGNPESVSVDHKHGVVWVGDDSSSASKLYKFKFSNL